MRSEIQYSASIRLFISNYENEETETSSSNSFKTPKLSITIFLSYYFLSKQKTKQYCKIVVEQKMLTSTGSEAFCETVKVHILPAAI